MIGRRSSPRAPMSALGHPRQIGALPPLAACLLRSKRWGNRPASLWIAENKGAALQADGETRSASAASSIRRRSAAWTILLDWMCRSRRRASALWMMRARSCGKRGWRTEAPGRNTKRAMNGYFSQSFSVNPQTNQYLFAKSSEKYPIPRGGSKPGERRGCRKPGTPNKPKGERAVIALERAESEVRVLVLAGDKITSLGKDRLAELDQWAYGMAQKFAPTEKEGKLVWENDGDELRFMRFMAFSAKCALGRAQFESPRYAAIAVANQGEKTPDIYKQDPYVVMEGILDRWLAADEAEKAEKAIDVTPAAESEPVEVKPNPDDEGIDGELA